MLRHIVTLFTLLAVVSAYSLFTPKSENLSGKKVSFCGIQFLSKKIFPFDQYYYLNYISQRESKPNVDSTCVKKDLILHIHEQKDMKQGYEITITQNQIQVIVSTYSGYVYALETIFSLGEKGQIFIGTFKDSPQVEFRGIMIDSVRHFLSVASIKRTIQAMSIVRMNMLHWHLTDDQAFTLTLQKHPQMVQGAYDKKSKYTIEQVKDIISFAKTHAVSIIPEVDTPGHVRSWSQNSQHMGITILCGGGEGYNHQMDLSIDAVWTLAKQIIQQVGEIFKDSPYIHLGGDEVFASCWNRQPAIRQWMNNHGISTYGQLQMLWRKELISVLPDRKIIFWRNDDDQVAITDDQILHYWGAQNDCNAITSRTNAKIIVSPSDYLYLNSGQGFVTGKPFGHYSTWRQIYQDWLLYPHGVNQNRILGALAALWGEVSNQNTLDTNLWPRTIVVAQLAWNNEKAKLANFVEGMLKVTQDFEAVGVHPAPFVPQYCETNPYDCRYTDSITQFPGSQSYESIQLLEQ